jgi:hypothetical protein
MPIQTINLGSYPNDGTGDDLRTAFQKVNNNFGILFGEAAISSAVNLGAGTGVFAQKNNSTLNLEFKTLTSTDSSVILTNTSNTVNLQAKTKLVSDTIPQLGATLDLNGHNISGHGDVQTTVWGIDITLLNSVVELLIQSGTNIDLGGILTPSGYETSPIITTGPNKNSGGYTLDMGNWTLGTAPANQLNFGTFV